jgi:hypothetical protein
VTIVREMMSLTFSMSTSLNFIVVFKMVLVSIVGEVLFGWMQAIERVVPVERERERESKCPFEKMFFLKN